MLCYSAPQQAVLLCYGMQDGLQRVTDFASSHVAPRTDHPSRTVGHTVRLHCQLYDVWGGCCDRVSKGPDSSNRMRASHVNVKCELVSIGVAHRFSARMKMYVRSARSPVHFHIMGYSRCAVQDGYEFTLQELTTVWNVRQS